MRILYCNKYDYLFSGTEAYLFDLIRRVDELGHEAALFSMDHGHARAFAGRSYRIPHVNFKDPRAGLLKKIKQAAHAIYSPSTRRAMRSCLSDFLPDLAHVRSIYHHLSPSILWELKRRGIPVLYHLNDFKILCPTYNLVADGQPCELCSHGAFRHVITKGCCPGARSNAIVLAAEAYLHKWLRTYQRCVDLFLAPSQFVRQKLIASGFCRSSHRSSPPLPISARRRTTNRRRRISALFRPTLSRERRKGTFARHGQAAAYSTYHRRRRPERPILESLARELNLKHVLFAGMVQGEKLQQLIAGCSFSVFPSHAYETFGKSILESYAWGRPVIATDLGSRREVVQHGVTGLLYCDGNREQLAHSIEFLFDRPDLILKMGAAGRNRAKEKHDPDEHVEKLFELYHRITSAKRRVLSFPVAHSIPAHAAAYASPL